MTEYLEHAPPRGVTTTMAQPMRPTGHVVLPDDPTSYDFTITYFGDLDACRELYGLATEVPLSFSLAAASHEDRSQITVSANPLNDNLSARAALEHLTTVHEKAIALGLDHNPWD